MVWILETTTTPGLSTFACKGQKLSAGQQGTIIVVQACLGTGGNPENDMRIKNNLKYKLFKLLKVMYI
jgi:hypothetical protein